MRAKRALACEAPSLARCHLARFAPLALACSSLLALRPMAPYLRSVASLPRPACADRSTALPTACEALTARHTMRNELRTRRYALRTANLSLSFDFSGIDAKGASHLALGTARAVQSYHTVSRLRALGTLLALLLNEATR